MSSNPIKRALISVTDKTEIIELAKALQKLNIEILSSSGTAQLLATHQIAVTEISNYIDFPEILGGRVKTLHPKIFAGLLSRANMDEQQLAQLNIETIDLLVVNLYPFKKIISNANHLLEDAIENIDIGGPSLIRAAAKNYSRVTVVTDPNDYHLIIEELNQKRTISAKTRFDLAAKAFTYTAAYDAAIANYFNSLNAEGEKIIFPKVLTQQFVKKMDLRYGENPHQKAALYEETAHTSTSIIQAKQLQGKELSFNNIADANAALECLNEFEMPACVIVKHGNPCGVAVAEQLSQAYLRAYASDPTSAFGGIIAINRTLDIETATTILQNQFLEVLVAPDIAPEVLALFSNKPNIRVLITSGVNANCAYWDFKRIYGGLLIQENDLEENIQLQVVTKKQPSTAEINDLMFAWKVCKFVKSNGIVIAKDAATIGIGAGQMSRVDSVKIAASKAGTHQFSCKNAVLASDAFFPFKDSVEQAAELGISAIIQPGGSQRDPEVILAADNANISMIFTGIRHFRH